MMLLGEACVFSRTGYDAASIKNGSFVATNLPSRAFASAGVTVAGLKPARCAENVLRKASPDDLAPQVEPHRQTSHS